MSFVLDEWIDPRDDDEWFTCCSCGERFLRPALIVWSMIGNVPVDEQEYCGPCFGRLHGYDLFSGPQPEGGMVAMSEQERERRPGERLGGTWPIAKQWPDDAVAQMDGRWFRLAHIGEGRYEVVDGPFGTSQRALVSGQEPEGGVRR